jgi:AraC-like DNA-binding protein
MISLDGKLEALQEFLDCAGEISFWKFDDKRVLQFTTCKNSELFSLLFGLEAEEKIWSIIQQDEKPVLISDHLSLTWLAVPRKIDTLVADLYIIGPVFFSNVSEQILRKRIWELKGVSSLKDAPLQELGRVPIVSQSLFVQFGQFLYHCIYGEQIKLSDYHLSDNPGAESEMMESEQHQDFSGIKGEIFLAVEEGNIDYIHPQSVLSVNVGQISAEGPLRQTKNIVISAITRITDAAIRGGLPMGQAYALSDSFILLSESATSPTDVLQVIRDAFEEFTRRVHDLQSKHYSPAVVNCISHIRNHLDEPFNMDILASEAGYSKNYLGSLFKQEVGMTPGQFALERKLKQAKIWLCESEKSIQDISHELGFTSVSYFGQKFRKYYKCTPSEYRSTPYRRKE